MFQITLTKIHIWDQRFDRPFKRIDYFFTYVFSEEKNTCEYRCVLSQTGFEFVSDQCYICLRPVLDLCYTYFRPVLHQSCISLRPVLHLPRLILHLSQTSLNLVSNQSYTCLGLVLYLSQTSLILI